VNLAEKLYESMFCFLSSNAFDAKCGFAVYFGIYSSASGRFNI
jgi:hypothetical protein